MRLKDKTAIITGAGAGIGAATAELFVREGARVVVADRDLQSARRVAEALGPGAVAVGGDVTIPQDVKSLIEAVLDGFGRLDILVNNAGAGIIGNVVTTSEEDWDRTVAINLKSVYLVSREAIPAMARTGGGSIVNVASNVATMGIKDRAAYVAAKGGVAALTRSMAIDHADAGIRVNSVAPGVTASRYYDHMFQTVPDPVAFRKALEARAPMARMGQPAEIANAILFLAGDESSFATGAMFTVDGGMTAWCAATA